MTDQTPSVVHYVSHGTPGGEYGKECRAAVITDLAQPDEGGDVVGLAVLNPTGMFFNRAAHHEAPETETMSPAGVASNHPGGTWHWPERV